ncbi:MAG: MbnP family protein [Bacteroidota bacterium]
MSKIIQKITVILFATLVLTACQNRDDEDSQPLTPASITIDFQHTVGELPLTYDTEVYQNALGQEYSIEEFKFLMNNLTFRNSETGESYSDPQKYRLVFPKASQKMSYGFVLEEVPAGTYDEITFSVGVDSIDNFSIAQVGDLDPSTNMAWNWNTGYKFLFLEGRYFAEGGATAGLVFHIGSLFNTKAFSFTALPFTIGGTSDATVSLSVDVAEVFQNPNTVNFDENPSVKFQDYSRQVSENYATDMIRLESVRVLE